ncbi:MAG: GTP pyrophosphokinase family protein [Clostridia bacterium]
MKLTFERKTADKQNAPAQFYEKVEHYDELIMVYRSAIREITTKLEILNDELSMSGHNNPIEFIKSRVKSPQSIVNKLEALGCDVNEDSIIANLNDVAGVRVVCPFINDVYTVAEMLTSQDDITVIEKKDYIRSPKANGYRSYHLILEVPVFLSNSKLIVRTEVQIRTVAMDFWASLEHQMRYKKELQNSGEISEELRVCAENIAATDVKMMAIRDKIKNG